MVIKVLDEGTVTSPQGFAARAVACGLKSRGKLDLALVYSARDCSAAGVFTTNQVAAAPVILDRQTLAANPAVIRGVLANAGNANACTGAQGLADAAEMQQSAAAGLGCQPGQLLVLSTGVIGAPLPMGQVCEGIRLVTNSLSVTSGAEAARAIMTTDTRPKQLALEVHTPAGIVKIGGMAKGSGMIHPNMATMLAVITTDAAVEAAMLQDLLRQAVDRSFNCISVDGDTSTNDTVLLLANGASGISLNEASLASFAEGLQYLCTELAKMIVHDGEGVTKFVEIEVGGALCFEEARQVAATIATSPLVKTALAGSDPNWGRILAAAGRAGVPFDQDRIGLWIGNPGGPTLQLVHHGAPNGYAEKEAAAIFARPEITIHLDLSQGNEAAIMWTGDLTHDYVTINADYRT